MTHPFDTRRLDLARRLELYARLPLDFGSFDWMGRFWYVLFTLPLHPTTAHLRSPIGHIAEETKNASIMSARGMFWSCAVSGFMAFVSPRGLRATFSI